MNWWPLWCSHLVNELTGDIMADNWQTCKCSETSQPEKHFDDVCLNKRRCSQWNSWRIRYCRVDNSSIRVHRSLFNFKRLRRLYRRGRTCSPSLSPLRQNESSLTKWSHLVTSRLPNSTSLRAVRLVNGFSSPRSPQQLNVLSWNTLEETTIFWMNFILRWVHNQRRWFARIDRLWRLNIVSWSTLNCCRFPEDIEWPLMGPGGQGICELSSVEWMNQHSLASRRFVIRKSLSKCWRLPTFCRLRCANLYCHRLCDGHSLKEPKHFAVSGPPARVTLVRRL